VLERTNQREELEYLYNKAKDMDVMAMIRDTYDLSDVCTYDMAQTRLKTVTLEITVRKTLSISTRQWLV
jgi:hypothetical protein